MLIFLYTLNVELWLVGWLVVVVVVSFVDDNSHESFNVVHH